jgi:GNAT superfamily N-acetyltransferase
MKIRTAHSGDAAAIASLMTQLGYPQDVAITSQRLAASGDHGHVVIVADDDGAIVGCIQAGALATLESDPFAQILALVVDENARGKRVGAQLVAAAVAWAKERGYAKLRVRVNVVRKDAHRFYEREGFRQLKEQRVYVRET